MRVNRKEDNMKEETLKTTEPFVVMAKPVGSLCNLECSYTPAAVMAELRAEAQARWRGIGRNDPCPCGSGRKAKQCCWSKRL